MFIYLIFILLFILHEYSWYFILRINLSHDTQNEMECFQNEMLTFCEVKCKKNFCRIFKWYSLQVARMRLWNQKQKGRIYKYIEEFCDLQVCIMNMSGAETLNVFKQVFKYSKWVEGKPSIHIRRSNRTCSTNFGCLWCHTRWTNKQFGIHLTLYQ